MHPLDFDLHVIKTKRIIFHHYHLTASICFLRMSSRVQVQQAAEAVSAFGGMADWTAFKLAAREALSSASRRQSIPSSAWSKKLAVN